MYAFLRQAITPIQSKNIDFQRKKPEAADASADASAEICYNYLSQHLVPACLATGRPQTVEVDYAEGQPTIPLLIHTVSTTAVADSGAGLSLLSFILFKRMNIDPSKLIKTQQFNIKNATGLLADAVLGHITLTIKLTNADNTPQFIDQSFLILRETFTLEGLSCSIC